MKFLSTLGKIIILASGLIQTTLANLCLEPPVVQSFDVTQYANNQSWYEVARTKDEFFENDLVCVHARYTPKPDGHLAVFNQGHRKDPDGELFSIVGDAYPKDTAVPAKLTVRFTNIPWESPYWIVYVDEGYQHAIVYSCTGGIEFGWILSRTALVDSAKLQELETIAAKIGLEESFLTPVLQLGC